ncbi:hypothetical protein D9613_008985 [Agrocybe pediades]|uniref:Uncharacterized protein n=1 Tax=Agrocybe pediades TaxID=84607 RepID=A0A8H4R4B6_9AGAR|nr:hypothetical protein D9613_008985 [Agrocybe pediades]
MQSSELKCLGCGRDDFPSLHSLASHRSKCRKYKTRHIRNPGPATASSSATTMETEGDADLMGSLQAEAGTQTASSLNPPEASIKASVPRTRSNIQPQPFTDDLPPPMSDFFDFEDHNEPSLATETPPLENIPDAAASDLDAGTDAAQTRPNTFGVYRVYKHGRPSLMPDERKLRNRARQPARTLIKAQLPGSDQALEPGPPSTPFANTSTELLMKWHYDSSRTKSFISLDSLVHDVILNPEFKPSDLTGFSASKAASALDNHPTPHPRSVLSPDDGWIETSVPLRLPPPKPGKWGQEKDAPIYNVNGLFYRKPLEVIKAALQEDAAQRFHFTPFEEYWKPSEGAVPERILSEIYNSDAFIQEHTRIRSQPRNDSCSLERVVVPIILYSDSTHLASFGTASLWPIYLYLGNQSKYERGKPGAFAAHHLAYIPKLDDMIQDSYRAIFDQSATAEVLTHLRRELMQAIWEKILDDDLMDAHTNGIVIEFPDGIKRRMFIRFFLYGADYPEKVLLACIKYLSEHPCPRCLVKKCDIHNIGTKLDMKRREQLRRVDDDHRRSKVEQARKLIYTKGYSPGSERVSDILESMSLSPTRNAFSVRLSESGFNFYEMFAPDLMHEFELGVWKATFTHLIRILHAKGGESIQILNQRYRAIPTFGRDTIRKFTSNVSAKGAPALEWQTGGIGS